MQSSDESKSNIHLFSKLTLRHDLAIFMAWEIKKLYTNRYVSGYMNLVSTSQFFEP